MKFSTALCLLSLSLTLATAGAQTAAPAPLTLKIATVDTSRIVAQSQRAKKIRDDRDSALTAARQDRDKKMADYQKANDDLADLKQKANDSSLTAEARTAAMQEYRKRLDAIQMDAATFQDALAQRGKDIAQNTENQIEKLGKDVFDVSTKIAQAKGYNLILDVSQGKGVIFQSLNADITDDVMHQVDALPVK